MENVLELMEIDRRPNLKRCLLWVIGLPQDMRQADAGLNTRSSDMVKKTDIVREAVKAGEWKKLSG